MLVDPKTMRITAVFDFEFTNVMPAQFASDLPWWLILRQPGILLSDDSEMSKEELMDVFEPRKEQFIRAMERVEAKSLPAGECLSARMRTSWESGRFWFNLALRGSFEFDDIYWKALNEGGPENAELGAAASDEKEDFLKLKKDQFLSYMKDLPADRRFNDKY